MVAIVVFSSFFRFLRGSSIICALVFLWSSGQIMVGRNLHQKNGWIDHVFSSRFRSLDCLTVRSIFPRIYVDSFSPHQLLMVYLYIKVYTCPLCIHEAKYETFCLYQYMQGSTLQFFLRIMNSSMDAYVK